MRERRSSVDDREVTIPSHVKVVQMSNRELPMEASREQVEFLNECAELAEGLVRQGLVYGKRRLQRRKKRVNDGRVGAMRSALNNFRQTITEYQHIGASIFNRQVFRLSGEPEQDGNTPSILLGLHIRACQVAREIHCLAQNGFTDGALARWRTMHELAVTGIVIAENRQLDLAGNYLKQEVAIYEKLKGLVDEHLVPTGGSSIDGITPDAGWRFSKGDYAWAASLFASNEGGVGRRRSPTFRMLEERAGLSQNRAIYSLASNGVHQNPAEVLKVVREPEILLASVSPSRQRLAICVYYTLESLGFTLLSLVIGGSNGRFRLYDCVEFITAGIFGERCQDMFAELGDDEQ